MRTGLPDGSLVTLSLQRLRVKGFFQWDMRVSKAIKIHERNKIDLIANFYDLTNQTNFGTAHATVNQRRKFSAADELLLDSGVVVPDQFPAEFGFRYSF